MFGLVWMHVVMHPQGEINIFKRLKTPHLGRIFLNSNFLPPFSFNSKALISVPKTFKTFST